MFQEPIFGSKGELILNWQIAKFNYFMQLDFEPATDDHAERLRIIMKMPDNMWFGIGFGPSMTETDMIAWRANGDESVVEDFWSTTRDEPRLDTN